MAAIELIPFIPESANYRIWHPVDFLTNEDEDGIVTLTSPINDINLTLSCYYANTILNESDLLNFFADRTINYNPASELKSVITDSKIWIERDFLNNNIHWIWHALSNEDQIILASINSNFFLPPEERHLFTFMLDKMEIYPSQDND